jgi:hypothetical protein
LGFWIGAGWETQNPKKYPKILEIQNPNPDPKSDFFWVFLIQNSVALFF